MKRCSMNKCLKIATPILVICLFVFGCLCSMAFTCGPDGYGYFLSGLNMVEFNNNEYGAYFIKAEWYGGYGYFTDESGEKIDVFYRFSHNEFISVQSVGIGEQEELIGMNALYNLEDSTLKCTVTYVADELEIGFTEITFNIAEIDRIDLRPFDFILAEWRDENDTFIIDSENYYFNRTALLKCYTLTEEGNIQFNDLTLFWLNGGFEIYDMGKCVASGEYDFDSRNLKVVLTFEKDSLFGTNKPFASYPALTITTDWAYYYG